MVFFLSNRIAGGVDRVVEERGASLGKFFDGDGAAISH
jgi:hypothetical protein